MRFLKQFTLAAMITVALSQVAVAQQNPTINLELNTLEDVSNGCRITFVATNNTGQTVKKAAFEIAFFNVDGLVNRLTTLNFGKLVDGRTSVRQFEIPGPECKDYSRLLINAVKSCDGISSGLGGCENALTTTNKSKIEFGA